MSLTGFEVYRHYLALKLHFTSLTYDVISAGGKTNVGQTAYMKRKDRKLFEYLASRYDEPRRVIKYLLANFAYGHDNVLYDRSVGEEFLVRWIKTKESLSRVFLNDLQTILSFAEKNHLDVKLMFEPHKNGLNSILKLYRSEQINVESVCIIHQIIPGLLDAWAEFPENVMLFEKELLRIRKLASFVVPTDMCIDVWEEFEKDNLK